MRRAFWSLALGSALAVTLFAEQAHAQFSYVRPQTNPFGRSAVSPYLNLNRGGNMGINYYGLVRPQVETNQSLQTLQQRQLQLGEQEFGPAGFDSRALPGTTGHRSYFFNYGHYFPLMRGPTGIGQ